MQISKKITRRSFLKKTTGVAVSLPYIVSSSALGANGNVAASNRITVGCIGVGPQGTGVMRNFLAQKDARVVAICDVKSNVRRDRQELVNYVGKMNPKPNRVMVVHGEAGRAIDLAGKLRSTFRIRANAPNLLDTIRLK